MLMPVQVEQKEISSEGISEIFCMAAPMC